jgi:fructose-1,6-bisphosphatase/sedoheptulose 1,7-bisphosphatase-like protein
VTRWIDLDELRRSIAAEAKARAMAAGLEGVRVRVLIAEPDRRGQRVIDVEVTGQRVEVTPDGGDAAAERFRLLDLT